VPPLSHVVDTESTWLTLLQQRVLDREGPVLHREAREGASFFVKINASKHVLMSKGYAYESTGQEGRGTVTQNQPQMKSAGQDLVVTLLWAGSNHLCTGTTRLGNSTEGAGK